MSTAYVIVTVAAAAAMLVASGIDVFRAQWVRDNMSAYGLPEWTLYPLAVVKAAGAAGLLAGLAVAPLGLAAAICLVLYFLGAIATILRARAYGDLGYPMPYLVLAAGSLALFVAS
ncbi:DoxX-like protein [Nocardia tenerifensis]|uniref:DoxX-like protein n=1 Tax=Nocardia tenerifensis TaxID=228006 RepID=A0A318KET7_9NOCA|nr:DoxX family protein [Nocardia tenerifensis]PXX70733.1 DoxX-like protein [Nocardia tenerifensis]